MARHDRGEPLGAVEQADRVHMADAAGEGRVVHEDRDRLAVRAGESLVEEVEALRRRSRPRSGPAARCRGRSAASARDRRRTGRSRPSSTACGPSSSPAIRVSRTIVVAGQEQHGHVEPGQHAAQQGVFLGQAVIGQVAGDDQRHRGAGCSAATASNARSVSAIGVGDAIGGLAGRAKMEVGEMGDEHGGCPMEEASWPGLCRAATSRDG